MLVLEWHDVHLDREQFASLLRDMGVSVQQSPDPQSPDLDIQGAKRLSELVRRGHPLPCISFCRMAQRRLNAGDYPGTLTAFTEELAELAGGR